jgi:hypothetical protein
MNTGKFLGRNEQLDKSGRVVQDELGCKFNLKR